MNRTVHFCVNCRNCVVKLIPQGLSKCEVVAVCKHDNFGPKKPPFFKIEKVSELKKYTCKHFETMLDTDTSKMSNDEILDDERMEAEAIGEQLSESYWVRDYSIVGKKNELKISREDLKTFLKAAGIY